MHHLAALAQLDVAGLALWIWAVAAVVVILLIAALASARRKRKHAVIKTRVG